MRFSCLGNQMSTRTVPHRSPRNQPQGWPWLQFCPPSHPLGFHSGANRLLLRGTLRSALPRCVDVLRWAFQQASFIRAAPLSAGESPPSHSSCFPALCSNVRSPLAALPPRFAFVSRGPDSCRERGPSMWWTHGETHVVNACGETPPVAPPHPCSQSARTCGRRSLLCRHVSRSSAAVQTHAEREDLQCGGRTVRRMWSTLVERRRR